MKSRSRLVLGALGLLALGLAAGWMARVPSGPVTPTGAVEDAKGWRAVDVVAGLEHPWALAWLPSGEMLVTERPGRLRVVRDGALVSRPVAGVPETIGQGHGGLMDIVLHPDFGYNRLVYFTYGAGTMEANSTRLARGRLADDLSSLTDVEVLHTVHPLKAGAQHFGSRLLWLPDGTLLLALGDGGNPPNRVDGELAREQAQKRDSQLGKVLRLRDSGSVPADNPFVSEPGVDPHVWTLGHRNIQGLARDPASGRIWANEHGSRGGDELNLLVAGGNYGWPRATYSIEYTFGTISPHTSLPGMIDPVVVWTPAHAPSGLLFYAGDAFPEWRGDLFSGALKRKEIRRVDLDADGRVLGQESIRLGARIRDVRQGPDGFIYVLTDEKNGRLLRLEPEPGRE
ncbi:PQQ-dependent sugar dehydrogenase [Opitutales bacterium ASA1]|uniref:PQQ-dependent sugar dehydrogenase n=1 Tax=Congregicoccus parvus TaxID=3081749 RepID=UPI002B2C889A|nr:PQQ-dependent sugar dehydrogenase [Opitutales bacterium ASA1]